MILEIVVQSACKDTQIYLPIKVQQSDAFKQSWHLNKYCELVVWIISALIEDQLSVCVDRALCALDDAHLIHLDESLTDNEEPLLEKCKIGYCCSFHT